MKIRSLILISLFVAHSAFADPYYLIKPFSVVSDDGIRGYRVNTEVQKTENGYTIDGAQIPSDYVSKNPIVLAQTKMSAPIIVTQSTLEDDAKAMEAAAARLKANAPAYVSPLGNARLGAAGSIGAAPNGSNGATKKGFYVNPDGSLGKRVGQK